MKWSSECNPLSVPRRKITPSPNCPIKITEEYDLLSGPIDAVHVCLRLLLLIETSTVIGQRLVLSEKHCLVQSF
jgi:hypothetical protein